MKGADLGFGGPTGGLLFLPKWKVRVGCQAEEVETG